MKVLNAIWTSLLMVVVVGGVGVLISWGIVWAFVEHTKVALIVWLSILGTMGFTVLVMNVYTRMYGRPEPRVTFMDFDGTLSEYVDHCHEEIDKNYKSKSESNDS